MKLSPKIKQFIFEIWLLKSYKFFGKKKVHQSEIIIVLNTNRLHGGLVDRFKGIITSYAISREKGVPFKICIHPQKFLLSKFLPTNRQNIYCLSNNLSKSAWSAKPIYLYNFFNYSGNGLLNIFNSDKQFHVYANVDYLPALMPDRTQKEHQAEWRKLFFELFYFKESFEVEFKKLFDRTVPVIGIHLRFHTLLQDFKEVNQINISVEEQVTLIENCIKTIHEIINENVAAQVLIVSDSHRFLQKLQDEKRLHHLPNKVVILTGTIAHLDVDDREEVLEKSLLDFYLLHKCHHVYQVLGPKMHNSQFSKYAAILGGGEYSLKRF